MKVQRTDVGSRIRADHQTVQGYAKIPARFSRTGVQNYPQTDGSVRREYRPPEEVFSPKTLASFDTAVLVEGHPAMVSAGNWDKHAVGEPRNAHQDGIYTAGELVVRKQATIDKINADGDAALCELSCGYSCQLDMKSGVSPEGEQYDAVQRDIVINHIGLGPVGWGRAGSNVRLHLDGEEAGTVAYLEDEAPRPRPAGMTPEEIKALEKKALDEKVRADALQARLDAATSTSATKELEQLKAERDLAREDAKKATEAADPSRIDAAAQARFAVLDGARALHGGAEVKTRNDEGKPLSDRQIMVAALVARDTDFKADGKSDDYIRSRFDLKVEDAKKVNASLGALGSASALGGGPPAGRLDFHADAELTAAAVHFDAAIDFAENYARAEPWKHGDAAALAAASAAMKG